MMTAPLFANTIEDTPSNGWSLRLNFVTKFKKNISKKIEIRNSFFINFMITPVLLINFLFEISLFCLLL